MKGHFDLDCIKYSAASVGEKRSVLVTNKSTKETWEVANRTEWYGHWKKKAGGILSEINAKRDSPFLWDEFDYQDIQIPEPIENVLHTAKLMVNNSVEMAGKPRVNYYVGEGVSCREGWSTLLKYKGNRDNAIRALALDEVTDYLRKKFKAETVTDHEVDDVVVMESYGKSNHFIIGLDKDYNGSGSKFFNINKPDLGVVDTSGFGKLWVDDKDNVTGTGRIFKLFQVVTEDNSDNYKANCFSDVKFGEKSAFKLLNQCENDTQLFQTCLDIFKTLYPEPKVIIGWRGDQFEIDALYVFQEMMNLAHLHRWQDDFVNVKEVMDKLGVKY